MESENNQEQVEQKPKKTIKSPMKLIIGVTGAVAAMVIGASGYVFYKNSMNYAEYGVQLPPEIISSTSFNSSFVKYFGTNKSRTTVIGFLNKLSASNAFDVHIITLEGYTTIEQVNEEKQNVRFNIEPVEYDEDGYIKTIKISKYQ